MKSEPESYSIDDLASEKKTHWDGVRNYQARNLMRDDMAVGDAVLFYHSSAEPPGVAGLAKICGLAQPDFTAWDANDHHFDPKASPENPIWVMVDIEFVEKFPTYVPLDVLKADDNLSAMIVCQRGSRLSIQPVEPIHYDRVCKLGRKK